MTIPKKIFENTNVLHIRDLTSFKFICRVAMLIREDMTIIIFINIISFEKENALIGTINSYRSSKLNRI